MQFQIKPSRPCAHDPLPRGRGDAQLPRVAEDPSALRMVTPLQASGGPDGHTEGRGTDGRRSSPSPRTHRHTGGQDTAPCAHGSGLHDPLSTLFSTQVSGGVKGGGSELSLDFNPEQMNTAPLGSRARSRGRCRREGRRAAGHVLVLQQIHTFVTADATRVVARQISNFLFFPLNISIA